MRTRSFWLLGGLVVVVASLMFVGHSALATQPLLELEATSPTFPLGGEAKFQVTVDAAAVGGYGELYAKVVGQVAYVQSFPIDSQSFSISTTVMDDATRLGKWLVYRFKAFDGSGEELGVSTAARGPIVEPEIEE